MKSIYDFINEIINNDNTNTAKTYFNMMQKITKYEIESLSEVSKIKDNNNDLFKRDDIDDLFNEYKKYLLTIFTGFYMYHKNRKDNVIKTICDAANYSEFDTEAFSSLISNYDEYKNAYEFYDFYEKNYGWNFGGFGSFVNSKLGKYTCLTYFKNRNNYVEIDYKNNKIEFYINKNKTVIYF